MHHTLRIEVVKNDPFDRKLMRLHIFRGQHHGIDRTQPRIRHYQAAQLPRLDEIFQQQFLSVEAERADNAA